MPQLTKSKIYQDAYYAEHKDEIAAKNKARYAANPEKYRAKSRITRPPKVRSSGKPQLAAGEKFGMLTVQSFSHNDARWRRYYNCKCDCGVEKVVHGSAMISGNTKSCGCLGPASAKKRALPGAEAAINQLVLGYKRHAKERGLSWELTTADVVEISAKPCSYCGQPPSNVKKGHDRSADFIYSGIDRVDSSKGYLKSNCTPACKICNFAKSNMTLVEFSEWANRLGSRARGWEQILGQ